jgi:hypothetical protein
MNKTLNKDNSKLPRRTDTAGCRSSLKDDSTIYKEEAKRNRKKRLDDLRRCLPIYALPLPYRLGDRASGACGRTGFRLTPFRLRRRFHILLGTCRLVYYAFLAT